MAEHPGAPAAAAPLEQLTAEGVSLWLQGVHCGETRTQWFRTLTAVDLLRGAVFAPSALARALESGEYQPQLARLADGKMSDIAAGWVVCVQDLRTACDALLRQHTATDGWDGLVSGGLDWPADGDPASLFAEAVDLSRAVARPNLLVQLPATARGLVAARDCFAQGIGVHVVGVAGVERYHSVLDAYFSGLERARAVGLRLASIASVASVPVGEVDVAVDARLPDTAEGRALRGAAGVSTARLLYAANEERLGSGRWRVLRAAGARPQRLMWTALDAPDAASPHTRYVDGLVSWGTVQAMPPPLLRLAARDARPRGEALLGRTDDALSVVGSLARLGVAYDDVVRLVEEQDITRSAEGWRVLLSVMAHRLRTASGSGPAQTPPGDAAPNR